MNVNSDYINVEWVSGVPLVRLSGRMDPNTLCEVENRLQELINANKFEYLIMDLRNIDFITSTTVHTFVTLKDSLKTRGKKMLLCKANNQAESLLKTLGIIRAFDIFDSEEKALSYISST